MNEKAIWDFLFSKLKNPYGVAGLMGNLYNESKLNPGLLQSSYAKKFNMTSEEYTKAVDNGTYENFIGDKAGYGLAQWTFSSRKELLLKYAKKKNKSIGDLNMQLEYLWSEIQLYITVTNTLKNATSVREASDIVLAKYERAADQSEDAKKRRANFGQKYYDQFAGKQVVVLTDRVNVRRGNDKKYARIFFASKGNSYPFVASSDNGWNAVALNDQVGWISGEFSEIR